MMKVKRIGVVFIILFSLFVLGGCVENQQFLVVFDSNGGSYVYPEVVANGSKVTLRTPIKEGHAFIGWFLGLDDNALEFKSDDVVKEHLKLYAKWEVDQYTISFDSNGGTYIDPIIDYYNSFIEAPPTPIKEGYTFQGWFQNETDGNAYVFSKMPPLHITLFAVWEEIEYSIQYHLNGGSNHPENPMQYTIETNSIVLNDPTKIGYEFLGWYDNADFLGDPIVEITQRSMNNVVLYARWLNVILENLVKDFYVTGNFASWGEASGNPEFKMEAIASNDVRVESIKDSLTDAVSLYIKEINLPSTQAGWDFSYQIEGIERVFDGNLTIKVIRTAKGDDIPEFWAQNPESGRIDNLTPDTLYIPPFVEENVNGAGTWNDNSAAYEAGLYYLVFVEYETGRAMGLIRK